MTLSVKRQEECQSRYVIPAHGPAWIEVSQDPEWIALQERRAAQRQRGVTPDDVDRVALMRAASRLKRGNGKRKGL